MTSSSGHSLARGRTDPSRGADPLTFPSFAADPVAWLEYVDALLDRDPVLVRSATPDAWTDPAGHRWRVVLTTDGPEVRPDLQHPFIRSGGMPRLTSIGISPTHITVEMSQRDWRDVAVVPVGAVRVRNLGLALLTGVELPHEGLDRLGDDIWERAQQRWASLHSRVMVAIEVTGVDIGG